MCFDLSSHFCNLFILSFFKKKKSITYYDGNDCNGPVSSVQNSVINQCMTYYDTTTGLPTSNFMLTLFATSSGQIYINETRWVYDSTTSLQCLGIPTYGPARFSDGTGKAGTNADLGAIGQCVSYPVSYHTSTPGGGSATITGFRSKKMVTSPSMTPISGTNGNPQALTGMRVDNYYSGSSCDASGGVLQLSVLTPLGSCYADLSQQYSDNGVTSYLSSCSASGAVNYKSWFHNMNCGMSEIDATSSYNTIPNQCAYSNAGYSGSWNKFGNTMMETCSAGSPALVPVTTLTTTGWVYAAYYSDSSCKTFVQNAGSPVGQCILVKNADSNLVVGSKNYLFDSTSGTITVNTYSGAGCSGAFISASYSYSTLPANTCQTTGLFNFHTQTNPFFPSSASAPFFHSFIPMYSATMPAGLGLTTVEYNQFDCSGIATSFVSINMKPVNYTVTGQVPTMLTFSCNLDTATITGTPLVVSQNTREGNFITTAPVGCGNNNYNYQHGSNSTSLNAMLICNTPTMAMTEEVQSPRFTTASVTAVSATIHSGKSAQQQHHLASAAGAMTSVTMTRFQGNDCNGPVQQIFTLNLNQCLTFYNESNGAPISNVMFTLSNGFNSPSYLNQTTYTYASNSTSQCTAALVVKRGYYDDGSHTSSQVGACISHPTSEKRTAHGMTTTVTGFVSQVISATASMPALTNGNLNPNVVSGMRIDAYYTSTGCASGGAVQMVTLTPYGSCFADTSGRYSNNGITSYRETCNAGVVSFRMWNHNMNCGASEEDTTTGYTLLSNQCVFSNAGYNPSYHTNWNKFGLSSTTTCSTGTPAPVAVTTDTTTGWAYAKYYTDSSCTNFVLSAGTVLFIQFNSILFSS